MIYNNHPGDTFIADKHTISLTSEDDDTPTTQSISETSDDSYKDDYANSEGRNISKVAIL